MACMHNDLKNTRFVESKAEEPDYHIPNSDPTKSSGYGLGEKLHTDRLDQNLY